MQAYLFTVNGFNQTSAMVQAIKAMIPDRQCNLFLIEKETQLLLGITYKVLLGWRKTGAMPFAKLGGKTYYAYLDIIEMLKRIFLTLPTHVLLDINMVV